MKINQNVFNQTVSRPMVDPRGFLNQLIEDNEQTVGTTFPALLTSFLS